MCEPHPDDIVSRLSNESQLGVVERTHTDIDSHEPHPQRDEEYDIKQGPDITPAAFRNFLRDGVPPKDTVLIRWEGSPNAQLIPTSKLKLVDRSLLIGDVVKKNVRDAMSGVVINIFTKCTLKPLSDVIYKDKYELKGLLPSTPLNAGFKRSGAGAPPLVRGIPAAELKEAESPGEEDLVIYRDWIGRVAAMTSKIRIKLTDNTVVEIMDDLAEHADGAIDMFAVGDIAVTKKGHLRTGKWIFGQYSPNTPPVGTVVETRPAAVEIAWLQRRIGSTNDVEPPVTLERDELESEAFQLYDRTRRPKPAVMLNAVPTQETVSNSEMDVRLGSRVRFKDLAGACVKYDGSTAHGKVSRTDRGATMGYDLNVFDVVRLETDVTVQWQNLSVSNERSIDLIPDTSIDDEHAAWPGEIAHSLDVAPVPNMPTVEQPSRVGVIQSVNAEERMANIRWAPDAVIHYSIDAEEDTGLKSLLTGAVGSAHGRVEDVSLYDLEAPAAMNVRRGDIVLIAKRTWTEQQGFASAASNDWLGEIVDTCLDGTLIVRLSASSEVRDVRLCREDVVVAVRSDGTGDIDGWDDGVEDGMVDDPMGEPEMVMNGSGNVGVWHGQDEEESEGSWDDEEDELDDESDEEPQATYEDENGQPLGEDEVEDEDWESEDEDDDVKMTDVRLAQTPPTSTSATPPDTSKRKDEVADGQPAADANAEPTQYQILDEAVPASHHYAHEPSTENAIRMKRVQKEHRILQKTGVIPKGVYIRTWESRLDLLRVLFIGASDTPYADAPFVMDFYLPTDFPSEPPQAFFHSWPGESGLGGVGRVNPNLYEDGKICLSLLGTWEGGKGEGWNAGRSTLLQVFVSLLGLVLVKEPYFNEAGYEPLAGLESSKRPSALYNERTFLRARTFVITALSRLRQNAVEAKDLEGLQDAVTWSYSSPNGQRLLDKVVKDVEEVLKRSEVGGSEPDGLTIMSKGACIPLRRVLERLRQLQ